MAKITADITDDLKSMLGHVGLTGAALQKALTTALAGLVQERTAMKAWPDEKLLDAYVKCVQETYDGEQQAFLRQIILDRMGD